MSDFEQLIYEKPEPGIARIWLNRPQARNAQDTAMLYELNEAFDRAVGNDEVKVIVLAAKGPHFSAGHDLQERDARATMAANERVGSWANDTD